MEFDCVSICETTEVRGQLHAGFWPLSGVIHEPWRMTSDDQGTSTAEIFYSSLRFLVRFPSLLPWSLDFLASNDVLADKPFLMFHFAELPGGANSCGCFDVLRRVVATFCGRKLALLLWSLSHRWHHPVVLLWRSKLLRALFMYLLLHPVPLRLFCL